METLGIIILVIAGLAALFLIINGIKNSEKIHIIASVILIVGAIAISAFCFEKQKEIDGIYASLNNDETTKSSYSDYTTKGSSGSSSGSGSFSNKYGTRTTKCAVAGCSNYIAKSGNTNCCVSHSNRCGNCNCYIDGDAMYCMSCLSSALGGSSGSGSSHECYICGDNAYSKYGSYYYCSDCKELVKAFSE